MFIYSRYLAKLMAAKLKKKSGILLKGLTSVTDLSFSPVFHREVSRVSEPHFFGCKNNNFTIYFFLEKPSGVVCSKFTLGKQLSE